MFCPGISMDANGLIVVTGGNDAQKTSNYSPASGAWSTGAQMALGRGYQAQTTIGDGRIFTIGGSWNGGYGGKNGEIYNSTSNTWTSLSGCSVTPILTADAQGAFRTDNHAWLFSWKANSIFQAGPSKASKYLPPFRPYNASKIRLESYLSPKVWRWKALQGVPGTYVDQNTDRVHSELVQRHW
jgi:galactose oxidase